MEEKARTNVNCASPSCRWNREGQKCVYPLDKPLVIGKEDNMRYIVINQYGIGGNKGEVAYQPRSTGRESYDACDRWCRTHDTANTMAIVEREDKATLAARALGSIRKGGKCEGYEAREEG